MPCPYTQERCNTFTNILRDSCAACLSGLGFLLCLAALVFTLPWAKSVRRVHILVEFNIFWKARAFLLCIGGFWLVLNP